MRKMLDDLHKTELVVMYVLVKVPTGQALF